MADENEVRDIVTRHQNQKYLSSVLARDISVLVELAEEWLAVKGLPEKQENPHLTHSTRDEDSDGGWCDTCQESFEKSTLFATGFNKALDACRLAVAKFYIPKDRLLTENEIAEKVRNKLIIDDGNIDMVIAWEITAAQQAKIEEGKCSSL